MLVCRAPYPEATDEADNWKILAVNDSNIAKDVSRLSDVASLRELISGMRAAYARGENLMEFARSVSASFVNSATSTLISYDLQAGSYVARAREKPEYYLGWCKQLAGIIDPFVTTDSSVIEVGCGEATTLAGVIQHLTQIPAAVFGFDISWSRIKQGELWLKEKRTAARLYVADIFDIPMEDESVDVVYTSHSLEPNGGREEQAIRELLRVARHAVVLIEPIYELAGTAAKERMQHHGYVRGLYATAEQIGAKITDYRLLPLTGNPLNPSGVIVLETGRSTLSHRTSEAGQQDRAMWRCPLTHTRLVEYDDVFASPEMGLVYPVLRGVPMLRPQHAIVASGFVG